MRLYAKRILLRNCGRFLHVSSDFGSKYKTHTFLTSEALYAGLTRELTRQGKVVNLDNGIYDFPATFKIQELPVWFTPGLFVDDNMVPLARTANLVDTNTFNVLDEDYPGTGGGKSRKFYCPTYGTMESVLPDRRLLTCAFAREEALLDRFSAGKVYLLGKKRTMFQVMEVSSIVPCSSVQGGVIWACQVPPDLVPQFTEYTVYAATRRYLLIGGRYTGNIFQAVFSECNIIAYPADLLPV